ncbi:hypothetical protein ACJMK2_011043, partial [Sinanodonta woodiana]
MVRSLDTVKDTRVEQFSHEYEKNDIVNVRVGQMRRVRSDLEKIHCRNDDNFLDQGNSES